MQLPDFQFHISNYTDVDTSGKKRKDSRIEISSDVVGIVATILLDGHIHHTEITDPKKSRKRGQIEKRIREELEKLAST
jgi:hypothetical protein